MKPFHIILVVSVLAFATLSINFASAQEQPGGVDHPGDWYVGEGLKKGDFFSYRLCHIDYNECANFQMDFWVEGDIIVSTEEKWLVQAVIYDGNKVIKGNMELGKIAPEPTGGTAELGPYRSAFKTSIVWLSAFATIDEPRKFSAPSWGKIANIGGQQIRPMQIVSLTTPAGDFPEVIRVEWRTGGSDSKVWVVDEFPFPIKAQTWTHVSEGIPPPEYIFELLEYEENVIQDPFANIVSTPKQKVTIGCPENYELNFLKKSTKNFQYLIELSRGPIPPISGCDMQWIIKFKNPFDETEFLNQVQFDIFVEDENQKPIRSVAQEEGKDFLFSHSGQVHKFIPVMENPGTTAHYVIYIYGTSPEYVVPPPQEQDLLRIDIPISSESPSTPVKTTEIPTWIKNNAGWWKDGLISDNDFVLGIQWLIENGIMKIPATQQGTGTTQDIPPWIKNNAGWWKDGLISDNDFVLGIQWLIENGIMKIA